MKMSLSKYLKDASSGIKNLELAFPGESEDFYRGVEAAQKRIAGVFESASEMDSAKFGYKVVYAPGSGD